MNKLLISTAIIFSIASCSNPVSENNFTDDNNSLYSRENSNYITLTGQFNDGECDTIQFTSGIYNNFILNIETKNITRNNMWTLSTIAEINFSKGYLIKYGGSGKKYRLTLFK